MLKGRSVTYLDKYGRVRIPAKFLKTIEKNYGREIFITTTDGENVRVYPISGWINMSSVFEENLLKNPSIRKFILRVKMLSVKTEIDKLGRVLINKELMDRVKL